MGAGHSGGGATAASGEGVNSGASADMPSAMRVRRGGVRAKGEGLASARADVTAGAIEGVPFGTSGNF